MGNRNHYGIHINMQQVRLPSRYKGRVYLHRMPGSREPLSRFVREATEKKISLIAVLATGAEIKDGSPEYLEAIEADSLGMEVLLCPLSGDTAPFKNKQLPKTIHRVADEIQRGGRALIHCSAGVERTGTVATCVLVQLGVPLSTAQRLVLQAGSGPSMEEFISFVKHYAKTIKDAHDGQRHRNHIDP